ncbi:MAG: DNA polymerase III subunit chi [Pseudomonadota bacterium]|nr:DNA polymerase III subunit chi [Pseudomonadota bacterium]MEC7830621.1 DNA polymerase III subunit chi [Pseudomonadota bacterium]MEC9382589.1 DNA polymerase III subunit chi [Pseudomonadota bacterium]MEC9481345.1 DNA polymerase III subunit chi [Pseudomonadota bacterium]
MPEFIFYKTAPLEVEKTLYSLVDKALRKEFNSILIFEDEEKLRLVDEFLWTYKQDSFLPHLKIGDALDTELNIPIYLTTKDENPFNARIFFSIDGYIPEKVDEFDRLVFIVDSNDRFLNDKYKNYYLEIKSDFKDIVFYKKSEDGLWKENNFMR